MAETISQYAQDRIGTSFDELEEEIIAFAPDTMARGMIVTALHITKSLFEQLCRVYKTDDGD